MIEATTDERLIGLAREAERLGLAAETAIPPRPAEAAAQYWVASLIWQHFRRAAGRDYRKPASGAYLAAAEAAKTTSDKAQALSAQAAAATDQLGLF